MSVLVLILTEKLSMLSQPYGSRLAECLEIKIVSGVTRISLPIKNLPFFVDDERKPWANLTVACHRHPKKKIDVLS